MGYKIIKIIMCLFILIAWSVSLHAADPLLVGVIEQPQCKQTQKRFARIMFGKDGEKWRDIVSGSYAKVWDAESIKWIIAFDGRNPGTIKIKDPSKNKYLGDSFYRRDKLYTINSKKSIPIIENKHGYFEGWRGAPDYRPFVIVSRNNYNDPEKWKPFKPGAVYKKKLYPFLKASLGKNSIRCEDKPPYNKVVPYDFKASETVLYKSYRSSKGKELVSIGLGEINCDSPTVPEWTGHWYLINGKDVKFVGREMELVDAGDYDNDGKSEFIFWYNGYNRNGYIMMYNSFRESVRYIWSYH